MNANILDFLKKEWKAIVILIVILSVIGIVYYEYKQNKALPMTTIQSVNRPEVTKALSDLKLDASPNEVVEKIVEAKKSPSQQVFVTATQKEADKKANEIAKTDKADAVIKEQEKKSDGQVVNEYYGIHVERTHKIKAGASVIDSKSYVNVGYAQGKNEMIIHYAPASGKYGVTYMRTLCEW